MSQEPERYAGGKILVLRNGPVGTIAFNQPEKRNAMSVEMWAGMEEVLTTWEQDDTLRVVVMTGAGDKAFISGADISQFEKQRSDATAQQEYERLVRGGRERLAKFSKPVIARIQGFCMGGGLAVAMAADIRIASSDSTFGIPAAKLGIAYMFSGVKKLVDLVGQAHANMLLLTGSKFDATAALDMGLVNQVVDASQLETVVDELAGTIAENAPLSLRANKFIIQQVLTDAAERDMNRVAQLGAECLDSDDYREGRTAFMEKRKAHFKGR